MRERPILFSAPMVRAILDGRKTVTRRTLKITGWLAKHAHDLGRAFPDPGLGDGGYLHVPHCHPDDVEHVAPEQWMQERVRCPYGLLGDRLWVRETHKVVPATAYASSREDDGSPVPHRVSPDGKEWAIFREGWTRSPGGLRWAPSIFMRRWASRIQLEIVSVRVERLQEITPGDIMSEGVVARAHHDQNLGRCPISAFDGKAYVDLRSLWSAGWDSINGKRAPWASNPWVWRVEFRRVAST